MVLSSLKLQTCFGTEGNITGLGKGIILDKQLNATDIGITEAEGKLIVQMLLELKAKLSNQYVPQTDRFVYMTPDGVSALIASWNAINRDLVRLVHSLTVLLLSSQVSIS